MSNIQKQFRVVATFVVAACCCPAQVSRADDAQKAEPSTRSANQSVLTELPFSNRRDFDDAQRGFIATLPNAATISGPSKRPAWSLKGYEFLATDVVPDTVNPSLWRQAQLNMFNGLFKVTDRIYQIRGLDLSNMTIVEGDTGLIIIDPLTSAETARAGLDLYLANRPAIPVVAVIYSHSHVDHFGGVKGVIAEEDVSRPFWNCGLIELKVDD